MYFVLLWHILLCGRLQAAARGGMGAAWGQDRRLSPSLHDFITTAVLVILFMPILITHPHNPPLFTVYSPFAMLVRALNKCFCPTLSQFAMLA